MMHPVALRPSHDETLTRNRSAISQCEKFLRDQMLKAKTAVEFAINTITCVKDQIRHNAKGTVPRIKQPRKATFDSHEVVWL